MLEKDGLPWGALLERVLDADADAGVNLVDVVAEAVDDPARRRRVEPSHREPQHGEEQLRVDRLAMTSLIICW